MTDKKEYNVEIGARIKREREKAGLTQERFSEMVGLGTKSVSAIECGAVGISISSLQKVCRVLSVSSDTLLFDGEEKNDVAAISARLEHLSPEQFEIAEDILNKVIEAFSLND